jgi:hypothetical protein
MLIGEQKVPIIGPYFIREIPASDNVCGISFLLFYKSVVGPRGFDTGLWKILLVRRDR